jgi:hypothetical protein
MPPAIETLAAHDVENANTVPCPEPTYTTPPDTAGDDTLKGPIPNDAVQRGEHVAPPVPHAAGNALRPPANVVTYTTPFATTGED